MYRILISLIFIIIANGLDCQTTFAKIIDFNATPQYADQIVAYKGHYYMAYTQICINEEGNLLESCGGVIKLDDHANMLDSNLIRKFSDNYECIAIDTTTDKIYLTGEEFYEENYAYRFMVNKFDIMDFKNIKHDFYTFADVDQINYFQKSTLLWKDRLILVGSSRSISDEDIKSLIFSVKDMKIDTSCLIDFGIGTLTWSSFLDLNNNLVLCVGNSPTADSGNKTVIVKLDTNFQEVWRWESPNNVEQLPFGCGLIDGRIVIAMDTPGFSNIASVWCVNPDKSLSWKMEFPEKNSQIFRKIFRLKQLKDGSIMGAGEYGNLTLNKEVKIFKVPFIFKISKDGKFLWEKAFYNTPPIADYAFGYFTDILEAANGDLIAVGRLDNYLEYDPIAKTERPDPDIIIVRTDANGCIDDDCATVTKIEKIVKTDEESTQIESELLFPNPAYDKLELLNPGIVVSIVLYDMNGRKCLEIDHPHKTLDTGRLSGLYIAKIKLISGRTISQKIVIL